MNSRPRYRTNSENTVGIIRKILFALTCLAALVCIVALFTINRRDSSALSGQLINNGGAMSTVSEHSGFLGVMFDYFGNVTYLFPLVLVYFGYKLFLKSLSLKNIDFFVIGLLILGFNVLVIGCCALFSTLSSGSFVGAGGILGDFFTIFLKRMFPSVAASLIPLFVTLVGIMLFMAKSPLWFCDRVGEVIFFVYAKITGKDSDEEDDAFNEKEHAEKSAFEEHDARKAAKEQDVTSDRELANIKGPTGPIFKEDLQDYGNDDKGYFSHDEAPKFGEGINTVRSTSKIGFGESAFGEGGTYNHERERHIRTTPLQGLFHSSKNEGYHERIEPGFGTIDENVNSYATGGNYVSSMRDNSNFDKDASSSESSEPSTYITGKVSFNSNEATAKDYDSYNNLDQNSDERGSTTTDNDAEESGISTIISGVQVNRMSEPKPAENSKPETKVHKTIISRFDPAKAQSDSCAYAKPLSYDDDKTSPVAENDKKDEKSSTIIYKAPYDRNQARNLDNINNEVSTVITRTTVYPKTTDLTQGKAFRPQDPYAKERATSEALKAKTGYQEENVINFSDLAKEQIVDSTSGISVGMLGQSFIPNANGTEQSAIVAENTPKTELQKDPVRESKGLSNTLLPPIKESDLSFEQYARGTRGVTQKAKDISGGDDTNAENKTAEVHASEQTVTTVSQHNPLPNAVKSVENIVGVTAKNEDSRIEISEISSHINVNTASAPNTDAPESYEESAIGAGVAVKEDESHVREGDSSTALNNSVTSVDLDNAPDVTTFAGVVNRNSLYADHAYDNEQPLAENSSEQNTVAVENDGGSSSVDAINSAANVLTAEVNANDSYEETDNRADSGQSESLYNYESSNLNLNVQDQVSKNEDSSFTGDKVPFEDISSLNGTVPYGSAYEPSSRFSSVPTVTYAVATETTPKFEYGDFRPSLSLLEVSNAESANIEEEIQNKCNVINKFMEDFGAKARVVSYVTGPVITRFDLSLEPGVKSSSIINLSTDLQRFLMTNKINMIACVPGTPYMGIEVPNDKAQVIRLGDVVSSEQFLKSTAILPMCVGVDTVGTPVIADLTQAPHLLIAGTTGSGKSSGLNSMLVSLLLAKSPAELRLIMVDPKTVEFSQYQGLPHLLTPIVTDPEATAGCLGWLIKEMERRYKLLASMSCSNIQQVNNIIKNQNAKGEVVYDPIWTADMGGTPPILKTIPYILLVIDEFADLMAMAASNKKCTNPEQMIGRLAAKARAAGIHLILATQTPRADIVTGSIRANMPSRIGYTVQNSQESRIVLDETGAENLLGNGDMMIKYQKLNRSQLFRAHGPFTSDKDVANVVEAWINYAGEPEYIEGVTDYVDEEAAEEAVGHEVQDNNVDQKFDSIVDWIRTTLIPSGMKRLSVSEIQTTHAVGFNRAKRIHRALMQQNIIDSKGNIIV